MVLGIVDKTMYILGKVKDNKKNISTKVRKKQFKLQNVMSSGGKGNGSLMNFNDFKSSYAIIKYQMNAELETAKAYNLKFNLEN